MRWPLPTAASRFASTPLNRTMPGSCTHPWPGPLQREQLADAEADLNFGLDTATIYRIDRLEGICATNLAWTPLRASRWEEAADAADRGLVRLTSVGITEAVTAQILAEVAAEAPDLSTGGAERLKRRPRRRAGTATSTRPRPPSSRG